MTKKIKVINSIVSILSTYSLINILFPASAYAVCPVCTVAVVGGLGLSRYFGIDDTISGIWVGGLMVSLTFWTMDWLFKRDWQFLKKVDSKALTLSIFLLWVILTYPPLYWTNVIGHPFNKILGVDKLIFGSILGAVAFLIGYIADKKVRKVKGRQLFIYQKVAFPVASLIIASLVLYFYGGYLYKL